MSFLSPWYLLGLLGLAIPLAIHLSRRPKAEKVVFSTIRFLKKTPKKIIFFQRIQQLLLLMLRVAIIALLALAFARPLISHDVFDSTGSAPRSAVILLDTSMSMQYGDTFEQAKTAAGKILGSLQTGDEAAIVTFSEGTGRVTELTTDLMQLVAFVRNLDSPGFNTTGYLPALRRSDQLLRTARYPDKTVYLVSDFRGPAAVNLDTRWRLSPGVAFETIKIGEAETTNLAVTEVKSPVRLIRDQEEHVILARVQNLGTRTVTAARILLSIDEKTVVAQKVDLTGGSESVVAFRSQFRKRGIHRGMVTVEDEAFPADNTFYFTVNIAKPLAILGVLDAAAVGRPANELRWFESALGNRRRSPLHLDIVRSGMITKEALQPYHVIVLANVAELTTAHASAIAAYLEKGGGLLIAPAARVTAQTFNRLFQGLTPGVLEQKHIAANGDFRSIAGINRRHPIIKAMGLSENGDFGAARFNGYWSVKPLKGSDVILRFDNGAVALLEKRVGRGRVLLFTSSIDPQWNNLARQGIYVPLVHETLRYLALHEEKKPSYTVGEPVRLILSAGDFVRVIAPHGTETILSSTIVDDVFYRATDQPGFYQLRGRQKQDVLAVNVSAAESDLFSTDGPTAFGNNPTDEAVKAPRSQRAAAAIAVHAEKSQRLWWWILLAVFFLALGETLLANRTHR